MKQERKQLDCLMSAHFAPTAVAHAPTPLTLTGPRIRLRPLQPDDAFALVNAAADGSLWESNFTVVPSALTVADYIDSVTASVMTGFQAVRSAGKRAAEFA